MHRSHSLRKSRSARLLSQRSGYARCGCDHTTRSLSKSWMSIDSGPRSKSIELSARKGVYVPSARTVAPLVPNQTKSWNAVQNLEIRAMRRETINSYLLTACSYLLVIVVIIFFAVKVNLLQSWIASHRAYVMERDTRWEKTIARVLKHMEREESREVEPSTPSDPAKSK